MSRCLVARLGIENCAYSFDDLYSFSVPPELQNEVQLGKRVLVPFGKGNNKRQGFVLGLGEMDLSEVGTELKSIYSVIDEEPLLNEETVKLALTLRERTFCTYFTAAKALLPGGMCMKTEKVYFLKARDSVDSGLSEEETQICSFLNGQKGCVRESVILKKLGLSDAGILKNLEKRGVIESAAEAFGGLNELSVKMVRLTDADTDYRKMTPKQKHVVELLTDFDTATVKEITYFTGCTPAVVKTLVKNGICEIYDAPVLRSPVLMKESGSAQKPVLSEEQKQAFDTLCASYRSGKSETALLFGVTGSGKTNVYLSLIDKVLEDGKNVIVLVPEISLTSQTISLFEQRFGKKIAVLHSGLSFGERRDEFFRIKNGDANVVIGTRSAIFAPLNNIGAIIIDEEQEHTYKSEMSPRYDARTVARFRCSYHGALLVLASATPSVETYAKAAQGKYLLCELTKRYGKAVLPEVTVVDMSDKNNVARYSAISDPLAQEIQKNLDTGEQSILLINRRGYNTFVACQACKHVITCPRCSISLTYHSANNRLMCHYCGYSVEYTDTCPICSNKNIRYAGFGTQRAEQELKSRFPEAKILRMDADTTTAKNAHEKALSAFREGTYDILIGTQMVAKGLDFPKVSLVGIVSADNELYNDDFRSAERTFDLITQVTGRAGRGDIAGRAYIQTVSPDNEILKVAARQDYKTFFQQEIALRKAMIYPPFCDICQIGVSAGREDLAFSAAKDFFDLLIKNNKENDALRFIVLGPLAPKVAKINNLYRQKIIIKCVNNSLFRALISKTLKTVSADKKYKNVSIFAVMNPESTS